MPEVIDTFSFDKGINTKKNPTLLSEGEMQECEGFAYTNDGYLSVMTPRRQVPHSPYGQIRNLHRFQNKIIMQEGGNVRYKWDLSKYCDQYIEPNREFTDVGDIFPARCRVLDYKAWTFLVNKGSNKVFGHSYLYEWGVDNPTEKPSASAGTAYTEGSNIGDMTDTGGLAAGFDGVTDQVYTSSASKAGTSNITAWIGKDWGAGVTKTIKEFRLYGSSDYGFVTAGDGNGITIKLQGATEPTFASPVDLWTQTNVVNSTGLMIEVLEPSITTTTAYRCHRILFTETTGYSGSHAVTIAEFDFEKDIPNGNYDLYYTYVVYFPNGEVYETAPSPSGQISVSLKNINWSGIGVCGYGGSGVTIKKRLYRYSPELGEAFFVDEIGNTTTTYTDSKPDYDININHTMFSLGYGKPPSGIVDMELYLQRIFAIKDNMLYWSEPYNPFAFKNTSAIVVCSEGEHLKSVVFWGDTLYIASESSWYRLVGSDPLTWMIKKTFADVGVINPDTVKKTKYGILGLWHDGNYLFDGATSKNITARKIEESLFTDTINANINSTNACYASMDSTKYYFYYSSTSTTVLDSCKVIDFGAWPEIRIYDDPFIATAHEYHFPTGKRYLARLD